MKTYLITGGAGFIGSNFIIYMLKNCTNIKIINVDKLTYAGNLNNLSEVEKDCNYTFVRSDICNKDFMKAIFRKNDIDCVVNFAAESHVDRSIKDPDIFFRTNIMGTVNLLNLAKNAWESKKGFKENKKFIQVSTDEVYGSLGSTGYFTEETPLDPHSPYSASKASADLIVKSYYDTFKMPVNITRCSNNYGPHQFPEKLIPLVINNCLLKKKIPVYGDGLNVRDWLHVKDHCRAIHMVINNGSLGEIYNIGGHNEKENIRIVKTIIKYLSAKVDPSITEDLIQFVKDRKGHDRRYAINPAKIKSELNWEPQSNFQDGIIKTIEWYLINKDWLDNVTSGEYQSYYANMYDKL